jgi:hypothetical protein
LRATVGTKPVEQAVGIAIGGANKRVDEVVGAGQKQTVILSAIGLVGHSVEVLTLGRMIEIHLGENIARCLITPLDARVRIEVGEISTATTATSRSVLKRGNTIL